MKLHAVLFACFSACLLCAEEDVRIVSFSPAVTETIFLLGGGKCLVGKSTACNYPKEAELIRTAGNYAQPNPELTASLRPTLVLADSIYPPRTESVLKQLGLRLVVRKCESVADYRSWVEFLGKELGKPDAARKECLRMDNALAAFKAKADAIPEKKRIRAVWVLWNDPLLLAGHGSLPDECLTLAGAKNAAPQEAKRYFRASMEWLLQSDPDVLIVLHLKSDALEQLAKHPAWSQLKAVKSKRVISDIPEDLLLRAGPRIIDGVERLRAALFRTE